VNLHYRDRRVKRTPTVCGVQRPSRLAQSLAELLTDLHACPRCLEWVVEQGQLAARRLQETQPKPEGAVP
jgi:hypothetical protein